MGSQSNHKPGGPIALQRNRHHPSAFTRQPNLWKETPMKGALAWLIGIPIPIIIILYLLDVF